MALDLRTEGQRKRDAQYSKIISEYTQVRKAQPKASNNQIITYIAQKSIYSAARVRQILVERHIIK